MWKKKKGTLYTTGRNVYLYSDYGEQSGGAVKKTKNRAIIWGSIPIPGPISGESYNLKRFMHLSVHCSTIYNRQDMEAT